MTAWYISLPFATFALICHAGRVIRTAPIAAWAIGKGETDVLAYYIRKGAIITATGAVSSV